MSYYIYGAASNSPGIARRQTNFYICSYTYQIIYIILYFSLSFFLPLFLSFSFLSCFHSFTQFVFLLICSRKMFFSFIYSYVWMMCTWVYVYLHICDNSCGDDREYVIIWIWNLLQNVKCLSFCYQVIFLGEAVVHWG